MAVLCVDRAVDTGDGFIHEGNYFGNKGPLIGTRHVQILLLAFCLMIGIATRASMAVQIVAMTSEDSSSNPDIPIYDWSNQSIILSSFFWAYVVSNLFAGPLEKKYGPKWFLFGAIFINSLFYTLIPFAAEEFGSAGVIACRILQGLGQGFMFPTQQVMLGLWAPTEERATCGMAVFIGVTLGSTLATALTGYLSSTSWGWPSSFYFFGAMGFLWCIIYVFVGQNSPETHPRITRSEKNYIQLSLNQHQQIDIKIPWKKIITSVPVLANFVAQVGIAWSSNMAVTEYSTYLSKVMNFDIKSNGLYSALPAVVALLAGMFYGPMSDLAIKKHILRTVNARRICQMIGGVGVALSLIFLSYLDESHKMISIALLSLLSFSQAAANCGNIINMVDISPRFAGVIYGLLNSLSQSIALFAPILVQYIVTDQTDVNQWRIVFLTTAGIIFGTAIIFTIFASGDRQPWDGPEDPENEQARKNSTQ
ncbi:putative inorganic phosphate cotransporter [Anthonomus grandis grandis]|uniref:putative inorganic phosphate cotransporter n=1 Tax=Anthonomus grandis grandis TaxID=2921223 RepID=UPI0021662E2A|nr:putative inorganic phosphate cotransporter [Anthonomus grandis grandis]